MKENLRDGLLIVMKKLVEWALPLTEVVMVMTKLVISLDIKVMMNFISSGCLGREEIILLIVLQTELPLLQTVLLQVILVVIPAKIILEVLQVQVIIIKKTLLMEQIGPQILIMAS
nr:MAG TPA: hypothetical protein [Caudoviricetes sp.]